MPTWKLADADERARSHPYTYYKPDATALAKVRLGEHVKLVFELESPGPQGPGAERMWVIVDSIDPDGTFAGRLDSRPQFIRDIQPGDRVRFQARHVIQTEHDPRDNPIARFQADCFVTLRVVRDGAKVGYLYRDKPAAPTDSGWRIMSGDEPDEYFKDRSNLVCASLGTVLNHDDSFIDLLGAPIGYVFRRDPTTGRFAQVR